MMLDVYKFSQYMTAYQRKSRCGFKLKYNGLMNCVNIDLRFYLLLFIYSLFKAPQGHLDYLGLGGTKRNKQ
jgi:hypothetical protein